MKDLSFVIIGKNAQWSITRLLDSIIAHVPPRITTEILYVDSASVDRTVEIVSGYPVTIIQLSADQPLCASAGRYIGSRYASADYICFLDSDMELLDGWLERALEEMHKSPKIAVITGVVVNTDSVLKGDTIAQIDYSLYRGAELTDIQYAGNAAIFRRSALSQAGGWNPYIISDEEPELCLRIRHAGHRVVCLNYPVTRHHTTPEFAISTLLARRRRRLYLGQGQTIRYYLKHRLLLPYLKERGYAVAPACVMVLAIVCAAMSWKTMNDRWLLCFLGFIGVVLAGDAVRTRSVCLPLSHLVNRAVILEGAIRGFMMHPHRPDEYRGNVTSIRHADTA